MVPQSSDAFILVVLSTGDSLGGRTFCEVVLSPLRVLLLARVSVHRHVIRH
jgi:hypothetical protein